MTLGGKIWNQDPDQIFIFFRIFFIKIKVLPLRSASIYEILKYLRFECKQTKFGHKKCAATP
jgi:hypothetical protein